MRQQGNEGDLIYFSNAVNSSFRISNKLLGTLRTKPQFLMLLKKPFLAFLNNFNLVNI